MTGVEEEGGSRSVTHPLDMHDPSHTRGGTNPFHRTLYVVLFYSGLWFCKIQSEGPMGCVTSQLFFAGGLRVHNHFF